MDMGLRHGVEFRLLLRPGLGMGSSLQHQQREWNDKSRREWRALDETSSPMPKMQSPIGLVVLSSASPPLSALFEIYEHTLTS